MSWATKLVKVILCASAQDDGLLTSCCMYEVSGSWRTVKLLNNIVQRLADQMPTCSRFYFFGYYSLDSERRMYSYDYENSAFLTLIWFNSGYLICIWIHRTVKSLCLRQLFGFSTTMVNLLTLYKFLRYWALPCFLNSFSHCLFYVDFLQNSFFMVWFMPCSVWWNPRGSKCWCWV